MRILYFVLIGLVFQCCKNSQLAVVIHDGNYGCINRSGKFVIEPKWDWIMLNKVGRPNLAEKDSLFGFINRKGEIVIDLKYKAAHPFEEGYAAVNNGTHFGFIDTKGCIKIPFVYDNVFHGFSQNLSDAEINDSCGYIDKKGNWKIKLQFDICYPFLSDLAWVNNFEYNKLIINHNGDTFPYVEGKFRGHKLWLLDNYLGSIKAVTGQGWVNSLGDTIIPPIYEMTMVVSENLYNVQKNKKWGVLDRRGNTIVPPKYDEIHLFRNGYAGFKEGIKWGFIDKYGKVIVSPTFDWVSHFSHGLAYVEVNGNSGFINTKGKLVIPAIFDVYRFSEFE